MKKNISRNPLWPDWYNGKKIDEVQFGRAFLEQWSLKCVNGTLYTLDGPVELLRFIECSIRWMNLRDQFWFGSSSFRYSAFLRR